MESLLVALVWCSSLAQIPADGCHKDTDCKGERICVQGECRDPTRIQAAQPASQREREVEPPKPDRPELAGAGRSLFGFQVDLGGFLSFGPSFSLEFGSRVALVGTVRAVGLGLMRHLTAGNNEVSMTEWAAGGSLRIYTGSKARRQGFYFGPTAEYVSSEEKEGDSLPSGVEIRYQTASIVVGLDTGYRWVLSSGMTLAAGAILGYVHPLDKNMTVTGRDGPSGFRNEAKDSVAPLLTFEVGYAF